MVKNDIKILTSSNQTIFQSSQHAIVQQDFERVTIKLEQMHFQSSFKTLLTLSGNYSKIYHTLFYSLHQTLLTF